MRSNINILKKKYNICTDKGLLNYLADKECMPPIEKIEINKEVADKPVKKEEDIFPEYSTEEVKEIFHSVKLDDEVKEKIRKRLSKGIDAN